MRAVAATVLAATFALAPAPAGPIAAQDERVAAGEPAAAFTERVEVELVDFDVVVTDAEGAPVAGLVAEDFEVLEDGRPVTLSHFVAVGAEPSPDGDAEPREPPALQLAIFLAELPGPMRDRALAALTAQLPRLMRPGARAMVVSFDGQLRVVQRLTGDLDLLRAALESGGPSLQVGALAVERRGLLAEMAQYADPSIAGLVQDGVGAGDGPAGMDTAFEPGPNYLRRIHAHAERTGSRTDAALAALESLVQSMAGLPGRKVVLTVAGGLETRPAEDLFALWDDKFGRGSGDRGAREAGLLEARRHDRSPAVRALSASANAAGVALYGLGPRDVGLPVSSAELSLRPMSGAATASLDPVETLAVLAEATGGQALAGEQLADRLVSRLADDVTSYYSLGFSRDADATGGAHELEVRVRREGLRARHRTAHCMRTAAERSADRTLAALLHDLTDNPIGIRVELGKPEKDGREFYRVPVLVRIPLGQVLLIPREAAHHAELAVVVAVQDAGGGLSAPRRMQVPVKIENERLLQALVQDLGYQIQLQVRPGEQKLAVAVVDELAAVTSTVNLSLAVGGG